MSGELDSAVSYPLYGRLVRSLARQFGMKELISRASEPGSQGHCGERIQAHGTLLEAIMGYDAHGCVGLTDGGEGRCAREPRLPLALSTSLT